MHFLWHPGPGADLSLWLLSELWLRSFLCDDSPDFLPLVLVHCSSGSCIVVPQWPRTPGMEQFRLQSAWLFRVSDISCVHWYSCLYFFRKFSISSQFNCSSFPVRLHVCTLVLKLPKYPCFFPPCLHLAPVSGWALLSIRVSTFLFVDTPWAPDSSMPSPDSPQNPEIAALLLTSSPKLWLSTLFPQLSLTVTNTGNNPVKKRKGSFPLTFLEFWVCDQFAVWFSGCVQAGALGRKGWGAKEKERRKKNQNPATPFEGIPLRCMTSESYDLPLWPHSCSFHVFPCSTIVGPSLAHASLWGYLRSRLKQLILLHSLPRS